MDKDIELLKRISKGDEESFRQLYELTHKEVYFFLFRLFHDKDAAEDTLIETFTEVWKSAKNFKGKARILTWIIGIAKNLAMNKLKKDRTHESIDDFPNISNSANPTAESFERQRLLKEAMSSLSVKHREVLDLVFYHEMTYQEVSEVLNAPLNTVKTRVFYAKEALRKTLSHMGVKRDDI